MIVRESRSGYAETTTRLAEAIESRGLTMFARIDHAAGAKAAALDLQPEEVMIFGNPQAGTPLMQRDPLIGSWLPLRMLIWQQGERVMFAYEDPQELTARYDVAEDRPILERMASLLAELASEAVGPT